MDEIRGLECWGCGEKFALGSASECSKCGGTLKPVYKEEVTKIINMPGSILILRNLGLILSSSIFFFVSCTGIVIGGIGT